MPKVFLVDDDESVVRALGRVLRSAGLTVEAPESPGALFERVQRQTEPACVVLDLRMPGLSGLEVQQRLNADPALPVIFLTAHGSVPASVQAMKQGAFEFLQKPVDITRLLDVVQRALDKSSEACERRSQQQIRIQTFARLTPREQEVARLVAEGLLNKEIGQKLTISEKTVKIHRARVMTKLEVQSVAELVRLIDRVSG
jgi:FixJ family two-component response regulator